MVAVPSSKNWLYRIHPSGYVAHCDEIKLAWTRLATSETTMFANVFLGAMDENGLTIILC